MNNYTAHWINGEYAEAWRVGEELESEGTAISRYLSGFGRIIGDDVARALVPDADAHRIDGGTIEFSQADVERVAALVREAQAKREARRAQRQMVRCDCGCTIPRNLVMDASLGTSCPDCYDQMSG